MRRRSGAVAESFSRAILTEVSSSGTRIGDPCDGGAEQTANAVNCDLRTNRRKANSKTVTWCRDGSDGN
jgi:hypothetical protein